MGRTDVGNLFCCNVPTLGILAGRSESQPYVRNVGPIQKFIWSSYMYKHLQAIVQTSIPCYRWLEQLKEPSETQLDTTLDTYKNDNLSANLSCDKQQRIYSI